MLSEITDPQKGEIPGHSKERLQIGPVPDWVTPCSYRPDFKAKLPGQASYLLWSRQVHVEERKIHVHVALRLETIQVVERYSHWRLEMLPQTDQITLHWIKIHRQEAEFDHTSVEKLRLVQDETDDLAARKMTWGMLLEDVRPGDILEWSYTTKELARLRPEQHSAFFTVPAEIPLGKFYFSVRFQEGRAMHWKSSTEDLQPLEKIEKGQVRWIWERENPVVARAEDNTPQWYVDYPWVQVSDWPDWETVATAFVEAWGGTGADRDIQAVAKEIGGEPGGVLQQIEKAIHLVQEEFRHLEEEDLIGQAPAAPGIVARRRFGNSLDLAFFLARLLNEFGAPAHPVLVHTSFRKSLAAMLPMPRLFNHVVVEYQARNERRWVDATAKGQGGGSLNRVIPDYGYGLLLNRASARLVGAPPASITANACEVKETLLLDTEGAVSLLAVVLTARGGPAEAMRKEFETLGGEAIARRRLQLCMDRFNDAQRTGPMEFRDDRAANEFFLTETFAVKGFLKADAKAGWYKLEIADDFAAAALQLPDPGGRRRPFALPYPCNLIHVLEVHCIALPPAIIQERTIDNPWLQYIRARKTLAGYWTVTSTLTTLADAVPAERIEEHAQTVREIRAQSVWSLLVPAGQGRPHQRSDFGKMPVSWDVSGAAAPVLRVDLLEEQHRVPATAASPSQNQEEAQGRTVTGASGASVAASGPVRYRRRKRHRRSQSSNKKEVIWQAVLVGVMMIVLLLLAITLAESSDRWLPHFSTPDIPKPADTGSSP